MGSGATRPLSKKRKKPTEAQIAARLRNLPGNKENIAPPFSAPKPPPKPVAKPKDWKHEYQKLQRKYRHSKTRQTKLEVELSSFKLTDAASKRTVDNSAKRVTELGTILAMAKSNGDTFRHYNSSEDKNQFIGAMLANERLDKYSHTFDMTPRLLAIATSTDTIELLRKQVKALKQRVRHSVKSLSRAVERAKKKWSFCRLTEKGIYTVQARRLARVMADSGCARAKVGPLMVHIGEIFGIRVNRAMDRRTVGRAIEEGGVAARMQAIYELSQSQGVTISADSTSNRGINIESSHMNLHVPDYTSGNLSIDPESTSKVRFLGVEKTVDHSSAESYSVRDWLRVLKGMHGDHAAPKKSTARGLQDQKHEAAIRDLGEEKLAGKDYMELVEYLGAWNAKEIVEAGGSEGWNALSSAEQTERDVKMMDKIVTVLGREAYNALDPAECRTTDLFVWGGCCMHKDLNSFKGGNDEMMAAWKRLRLTGKCRAASESPGSRTSKDAVLTDDQFHAFEASTRGGVKTAALAGAIFNNKDDKKGQADRHVDFMSRSLGTQHRRFPDTSNTRFGSHGDAAAELLTYLPQYREIMLVIEWSKQNPSLTNIEKNLRDALNDIPTLTELAAMTIYKMIIAHPYLRQVRGPGTESTNLLDLGPLHRAIRDHIQLILDNPDLIFGSNASYESATLDGLEWADPKAMKAVFELIPSLPHIKDLTLAFFRGALTTWTRFSAEFAPGGLINLCTATEKQLAWIPSTNDANEGALGAHRVALWNKPSLMLHQYNALAMFRRNDTQDFMDAVFTDDDHAYIMREARRIDASGAEAERRRQIVDFRVQTAKMNKDKAVAKAKRDAEILQAHLKRRLVTFQETGNLKVPEIVDQLNAYRARGVPNISPISHYKLKADKLAALKKAYEWYEANQASQTTPASVPHQVELVSRIVEDWAAEEDVEMED
ncbi:hypothetical protein MVEN_02607600 [Mycena venus]|uniref:Uncharacterized protein n=1 Tax=Mycena venus TaxID=2733690 RepID=A0A8H6U2Z7_9AGAR|nr:hypothetical protein MVEN_02607600 [Mycena venus]